jgi:hypothetical protein
MTAQTFGWAFAKEVDFYHATEDADPGFAKVAKQKAKFLSQERLLASKPRGIARRGGYHPYASGAPSAAASSAPQPLMASASPRPPFDKSKLRCNYCKELGHFVRECTKTPQANQK